MWWVYIGVGERPKGLQNRGILFVESEHVDSPYFTLGRNSKVCENESGANVATLFGEIRVCLF